MEMSADYEAEQRELKDRAAALQGELDKAQMDVWERPLHNRPRLFS